MLSLNRFMSIYLDNYAHHLLANNCNVSPSWVSSGNAYKTKCECDNKNIVQINRHQSIKIGSCFVQLSTIGFCQNTILHICYYAKYMHCRIKGRGNSLSGPPPIKAWYCFQ